MFLREMSKQVWREGVIGVYLSGGVDAGEEVEEESVGGHGVDAAGHGDDGPQ